MSDIVYAVQEIVHYILFLHRPQSFKLYLLINSTLQRGHIWFILF